MMLQQSVLGPLCILLFSLHKIASNKFSWRGNGRTCDYGRCCDRYILMCTNLTTETFAQCPTNIQPCYSDRCLLLDIRNSKPFSVDKIILPCRLYELTLVNNQIHTIANDTFNDHSTMRRLNLEYNQITEIDFLDSLSNLQVLNLAFNKLECIKGTVFDSLANLQELYLNDNVLNSVEDGVFQKLKKLRHFQLSNNKLHVISKHTLDLHKLELFDLANNTISVIGPESFAGFPNLRHLLLNNNFIKNVPLGTFNNIPRLNKLQLGNNYLTQFQTGSFSNLGKLKYSNLSHNNFSTLNDTVLYPLRNLELLDLNNNNFTYINYTSLLLHLPNLHYISINDNNWACQLLTHMLKTFRARSVNYLFNATTRYTEENVDGIYCTENPVEDKINLPKLNKSQLLKKADSISFNLFPRQIQSPTNDSTILLDALKNSIDSLLLNIANSKSSNADLKDININFNSSLYVISILMLSSSLIICTLFIFTVYKKYLQNIRQSANSRSEIELLNSPP